MDPYTRKRHHARCMWVAMHQAAILSSLQSNYHGHARPTIFTYDPNILSAFGIKHVASKISRTSAHSGVTDLCLLLYPQHILSLLTQHYFSSLLLEWPGWTWTTLGSRLCWCRVTLYSNWRCAFWRHHPWAPQQLLYRWFKMCHAPLSCSKAVLGHPLAT